MPHSALLSDFLSGDPTRIWSASGAVRACNDRAVLARLAAFADQIEEETKGIDLGGGILPNSVHLEFALRKLRHVLESDECLCNFFLGDSLASPEVLARAGQLEVLSNEANAENYSWLYECRCPLCRNRYLVEEIGGYHYPWFKWARVEQK